MKKLVLGILAHVDAGKTTLSEGLLYVSGNISKIGRVDNRDAFLDTYELEKERGITIFSKQALIRTDNCVITLLDTPGHVDFSAEMERTLQVLDAAILVISASDGVQGHTKTLWELLGKYKIPTYLFINKMDQEGSDREAILAQLQEKLGDACVDFSDTESEKWKEQVAVCDEHLLNRFLEDGTVTWEMTKEAVAQRKIFPCMFGSALKLSGVEEFLQLLTDCCIEPAYPAEFGARVFKIGRDEQGNRLTYLKVTGGTLNVKDILQGEKVNQIRIYSGAKYETVNEATPGCVCAVTGLSKTRPGEGIGIEEESILPILEPVLTYKIELSQGMDALQVLPKLRQLEEEEPQLHIVWDERLKELRAQIMGEVQIEVLKRLILERFQIPVTFEAGSILYKETISDTVEGVGHFEPLRHYAEVHLLLEPAEPGTGIQILTDCSEDKLNRNWQRLIVTHLEEKEHKGVLTGAPITDIRITLIAGKAHIKHTEGGDFRQATYRALRQGLMQAHSVLLEPYYEFRLELPQETVGRAMTDIEKRGGNFVLEESFAQATADGEKIAVLSGSAPVRTMQDYAMEVIAYTKGKGRLFCLPKGYFPVKDAEEIVEKIGYHPLEDTENPADSVFCSHGAGTVIPWNEVFSYMHLPLRAQGGKISEDNLIWKEGMQPLAATTKGNTVTSDFIDIEEIDEILERTFHANRKEKFIPHKGIARGNKERLKPIAATTREYRPQPKRERYLLVDGYNVIFAWEELKELAKISIDGARGSLIDILCNYQAIKGCNLILVFDAYRVQGHKTEWIDYRNIHIVYTKEAETADQYIEHFAHENGKKYDITVATSDGLEQIIIRGHGCNLLSSRELQREIETTLEDFRETYLKE